ncbi:MAG: hypothetical protein M1435_03295, partial [Actinobacteria bacterium]|nr:hypothetical protein [Actinomycetota bacterium]
MGNDDPSDHVRQARERLQKLAGAGQKGAPTASPGGSGTAPVPPVAQWERNVALAAQNGNANAISRLQDIFIVCLDEAFRALDKANVKYILDFWENKWQGWAYHYVQAELSEDLTTLFLGQNGGCPCRQHPRNPTMRCDRAHSLDRWLQAPSPLGLAQFVQHALTGDQGWPPPNLGATNWPVFPLRSVNNFQAGMLYGLLREDGLSWRLVRVGAVEMMVCPACGAVFDRQPVSSGGCPHSDSFRSYQDDRVVVVGPYQQVLGPLRYPCHGQHDQLRSAFASAWASAGSQQPGASAPAGGIGAAIIEAAEAAKRRNLGPGAEIAGDLTVAGAVAYLLQRTEADSNFYEVPEGVESYAGPFGLLVQGRKWRALSGYNAFWGDLKEQYAQSSTTPPPSNVLVRLLNRAPFKSLAGGLYNIYHSKRNSAPSAGGNSPIAPPTGQAVRAPMCKAEWDKLWAGFVGSPGSLNKLVDKLKNLDDMDKALLLWVLPSLKDAGFQGADGGWLFDNVYSVTGFRPDFHLPLRYWMGPLGRLHYRGTTANLSADAAELARHLGNCANGNCANNKAPKPFGYDANGSPKPFAPLAQSPGCRIGVPHNQRLGQPAKSRFEVLLKKPRTFSVPGSDWAALGLVPTRGNRQEREKLLETALEAAEGAQKDPRNSDEEGRLALVEEELARLRAALPGTQDPVTQDPVLLRLLANAWASLGGAPELCPRCGKRTRFGQRPFQARLFVWKGSALPSPP